MSVTEDQCYGQAQCYAQVQTPPGQPLKLKRVLSVGATDPDDCPPVPDLKEGMEIELEVSEMQTVSVKHLLITWLQSEYAGL